jgi:hypothetical protein
MVFQSFYGEQMGRMSSTMFEQLENFSQFVSALEDLKFSNYQNQLGAVRKVLKQFQSHIRDINILSIGIDAFMHHASISPLSSQVKDSDGKQRYTIYDSAITAYEKKELAKEMAGRKYVTRDELKVDVSAPTALLYAIQPLKYEYDGGDFSLIQAGLSICRAIESYAGPFHVARESLPKAYYSFKDWNQIALSNADSVFKSLFSDVVTKKADFLIVPEAGIDDYRSMYNAAKLLVMDKETCHRFGYTPEMFYGVDLAQRIRPEFKRALVSEDPRASGRRVSNVSEARTTELISRQEISTLTSAADAVGKVLAFQIPTSISVTDLSPEDQLGQHPVNFNESYPTTSEYRIGLRFSDDERTPNPNAEAGRRYSGWGTYRLPMEVIDPNSLPQLISQFKARRYLRFHQFHDIFKFAPSAVLDNES